MRKLLTILLAIMLMAAALPALAADGYPDNILLDTGVPYGNYGYPGLVKLHDGDAAKIDAHMRSAKSNQQGGGTGSRASTATTAAKVKDLLDQVIARLEKIEGPDAAELLEIIRNELSDVGTLYRETMNGIIAELLDGASLSDLSDDEVMELFPT